MIIELADPREPMYLLVSALPERVTPDDLWKRTYGTFMTELPEGYTVDVTYPAVGEEGAWVRP